MNAPSPETLRAQNAYDRALKRSVRFHLGLLMDGLRHYRATDPRRANARRGVVDTRPN